MKTIIVLIAYGFFITIYGEQHNLLGGILFMSLALVIAIGSDIKKMVDLNND